MTLTDYVKKHPAITCLTAGIIYSVQFWSDYTFIFAFPGLALYFFALFSCERKAFFRYSYLFCFGFYIPLYYWFMALYPFDGFGFSAAEGITIVIVACIGIALYHSLLTAGVMWLIKFVPANKHLLAFSFASLWTIGEWVLSLGELSFSWGKMAVGQAMFLPMVETASLFGHYFICFIIALISAYLGLWLMTGNHKLLCISAGVHALNLVCGTAILLMQPKTENKTDIAIIQGCITGEDKWRPDYYDHIVETYVYLCEEAADEGAKILFLPESPLPRYSSEDCERLKPLAEVAKEKGVTILTGVLVADDEDRYYNSIVAIYPDGSISNRYDKRHPVPFGETVPYGDLLTSIIPALGNMNLSESLTAGKDTSLIKAEGYIFSPLVCFDSIFASFSREGVRDGADIIFVATNDSWYKSTRGVYQHRNFSVIRAIETGRPVIRAGNTGISCIIDPRGRIISQTEPMVEDILYGEAVSCNTVTLYSLIGDVWLYLCIAYTVSICSYGIYKQKKKVKTDDNKS